MMDFRFQATSVATEPNRDPRFVDTEVCGVDETELLGQIESVDAVDHYGADEVLPHIDINTIINHFGADEFLNKIGEDEARAHFDIKND